MSPDAPGAGPRTAGPLVLVADDDANVRDLVCHVLVPDGFRPLTASDGLEVLELARLHQPALIVLDVVMPHLDGYTTLMRLRGDPITRDIPVIVLTGHAIAVYRTLSAGVGALAHMTKPFSPRQLTQTVRRILRGAAG